MSDEIKTGPLEYGHHPINLWAVAAVRKMSNLSIKAKFLYEYLVWRQGIKEAVWMGKKDMMEHNGMTLYQVESALNELLHAKDEDGEDQPLMSNEGQRHGSSGMTRIMVLLPPLSSKEDAIHE